MRRITPPNTRKIAKLSSSRQYVFTLCTGSFTAALLCEYTQLLRGSCERRDRSETEQMRASRSGEIVTAGGESASASISVPEADELLGEATAFGPCASNPLSRIAEVMTLTRKFV